MHAVPATPRLLKLRGLIDMAAMLVWRFTSISIAVCIATEWFTGNRVNAGGGVKRSGSPLGM